MPSMDEMRSQFDGLSLRDKYEYVTQLKEFVETRGKPEHREFLIECINKYNAEAQRAPQVQASANNPPAESKQPQQAERPEYSKPQQPPKQTEYGNLNTAQGDSPRDKSAEQITEFEKNTGRIEKPAGSTGNALTAIPKPIIISIATVVVVGIMLLTLWATGILPWGRNADDPDDTPQIENTGSGDDLDNVIANPETDIIVLSRVAGTDTDAAISDEEMYAAVFDDVRNEFSEYGREISEIEYAFYDMDGNGVKELFFTCFYGGYAYYTLSDGNPVNLGNYFVSRYYLGGINELGYIFVNSSYNQGDFFNYSRMAEDGVSLIDIVLSCEVDPETGDIAKYEIISPDVTQEITEAEYNEYIDSMTAPFVELDWKPLTETTGTGAGSSQSGGRHPFAIALEDYIDGAQYPAAWYIQSMQDDGIDVVIATKGEYEYTEFTLAGNVYTSCYKPYRLFYIHNGVVRIYEFEHSYEDSFYFTPEGYIIVVTGPGDDFYSNIFSILSGEVISTRLSNSYQYDEAGTFAYHHGEEAITQEEFNEYIEKYGLGDSNQHSRVYLSNFDYVTFASASLLEQGIIEHPGEGDANVVYVENTNRDEVIIEEGYNPGQIVEILAMTQPEPLYSPTTLSVTINGNAVDLETYNINGGDYFNLRDIAMALSGTSNQFDISYDGATDELALLIGQPYTSVGGELSQADSEQPAEPMEWIAWLNGAERSFLSYLISGNHYFPANDITQLLGIDIKYEAETATVSDDGWRDAYAEYLRSGAETIIEDIYSVLESDFSHFYPGFPGEALEFYKGKLFTLHDIDNSGIPELILMNGEVMAFADGAVTSIGNIGAFPSMDFINHQIDNADMGPPEDAYGAVIGIPDDGSDCLIVHSLNTFMDFGGGSLSRVYIQNGTLETDFLFRHMGYRYNVHSAEYSGGYVYDESGNELSQSDFEQLKPLTLYTTVLEFYDITEDNIQGVVYGYNSSI